MPKETTRVSLTLPEELLKKIDKVVKTGDYSSRSKAVRDALRDFLANHKWRGELSGKVFGAIILVYDHDTPDLVNKLLDIQHGFRSLINSVQHLHVSESDCLETLIIQGDSEKVRELVNKLKSLRGVKQVKLTTVGK
ncbi:MAG: nickel-responsive transcriptional regulator NikR [Hadesarchaea archaeon]|nr:nickel-responsive transcriptional regulator NikR [Hadesarchaea archaeon]